MTKKPESRREVVYRVIKALLDDSRKKQDLLASLMQPEEKITKDMLNQAFFAGRAAIVALPDKRAESLNTSEVAVYLWLGPTQATKLMAEKFRPNMKSPKDFRSEVPVQTGTKIEEKEPPASSWHSSSKGGNRRPEWFYNRFSINPWWKSYCKQKSTNSTDAALQRLPPKPLRAPVTEEEFKAENARLAALNEILLRRISELEKITTFAALSTKAVAFLTNATGQIVDHLVLPQLDDEAITGALSAGGKIEHLTLQRALTDRAWTNGEVRMPWRDLFHSRVEQERKRLAELLQQSDGGLAKTRVNQMERRSPDHSQPMGRSRSRS